MAQESKRIARFFGHKQQECFLTLAAQSSSAALQLLYQLAVDLAA